MLNISILKINISKCKVIEIIDIHYQMLYSQLGYTIYKTFIQ